MKSVTIKDRKGNLLIKISHNKSGYLVERLQALEDLDIEIRDDKNQKVWLQK